MMIDECDNVRLDIVSVEMRVLMRLYIMNEYKILNIIGQG